MLPVTIQIGMADIKRDVENAEGGLTEKLKAAMKAMRNHWMVTNEDEQFKAAIGAVMTFYGSESEEFKRLEWEMGNINRFSAMMSAAQSGLRVDIDTVIQEEGKYEAIGLLDMWCNGRDAT